MRIATRKSIALTAGSLIALSAGTALATAPSGETVKPLARGPLVMPGDAGYDAEWVHVWCREGAGLRSWIPPAVHRADGTAGGEWRARMAQGLPPRYGRRWAVESFISGMKRVVGPWLRARQSARQLTEALWKAVVYSIHR